MERFRQLTEILRANNVGFVGCQKCVHPTFKLLLESKVGVICLFIQLIIIQFLIMHSNTGSNRDA